MQNSEAIKYVNELNEELSRIAVARDPFALWYLKGLKKLNSVLCESTLVNGVNSDLAAFKREFPELCKLAVEMDPYVFGCIEEKTSDICMAAVRRDYQQANYIHEWTPELRMAAVRHDGRALQFIDEQDEMTCLVAVQQSVEALKYVRDDSLKRLLAGIPDERLVMMTENELMQLIVEKEITVFKVKWYP